MHDTTERPKGMEAGFVRLGGTSRERIVLEAAKILAEGSWINPAAPASTATGMAAQPGASWK